MINHKMKPNSKHPYRPDFSHRLSADDFISTFEKNKDIFKNLRVFLSKDGKTEVGDRMVFLSKNTLSIVRIEDVSYEDELIVLDLYDILGKKRFKFHLNIFSHGFQCMFYKLQDLLDMINQAMSTQEDNPFDEGVFSDRDVEDLLELDETQPIQQL
jgi:hypothetical protein